MGGVIRRIWALRKRDAQSVLEGKVWTTKGPVHALSALCVLYSVEAYT